MAKSKIIKDLANSEIDIFTALKRTKVLLQDLSNEEILKWINYEIEGYPFDSKLPNYRVVPGQLCGIYVKNHIKFIHKPIPLESSNSFFESVKIYPGIKTLMEMLQEGKTVTVAVLPELYDYISLVNNATDMTIHTAYVKACDLFIKNISKIVENKLLDILILLEKEFGNLDELDINVESKTEEDVYKVCYKIQLLIYNDDRVIIGNNNHIKSSTISSNIER